MCSVWISKQTATFALHSISRMVLYNPCGKCTRYALSLYINQTRLFFKRLNVLIVFNRTAVIIYYIIYVRFCWLPQLLSAKCICLCMQMFLINGILRCKTCVINVFPVLLLT